MSDWQKIVAQIANNVEEHFDSLKLHLRQRLGIGPVHILPYLGHGTRQMLYLRGRAVADYDVVAAEDNDSIWDNLLNMYRRFNSHEIPFARIQAHFGDHQAEVTANEEGFFEVRLALDTPISSEQIWHEIELELVEYDHQDSYQTTGRVIVPPDNAEFGVISDLDDTVIQTDVLHWLRMARNTFLHNSRTRLPFAGVAEFYRALQQGTQGSYNPIYYVSNSPWNLYDLMVDFFEVRGIPLGAMFLTDLGLTADHLIREDPLKHKLNSIKTLLNTHPHMPFILIGDSGEKDPEIYLRVVLDHPGRISAVYIRDVSETVRDQEIQSIVEQVRVAGSEMLLVPDTVAAAVHAAEHGFILPDTLPGIQQERTEDKKEPDTTEKLIDAITK